MPNEVTPPSTLLTNSVVGIPAFSKAQAKKKPKK
jgi:hypothetical protein